MCEDAPPTISAKPSLFKHMRAGLVPSEYLSRLGFSLLGQFLGDVAGDFCVVVELEGGQGAA